MHAELDGLGRIGVPTTVWDFLLNAGTLKTGVKLIVEKVLVDVDELLACAVHDCRHDWLHNGGVNDCRLLSDLCFRTAADDLALFRIDILLFTREQLRGHHARVAHQEDIGNKIVFFAVNVP